MLIKELTLEQISTCLSSLMNSREIAEQSLLVYDMYPTPSNHRRAKLAAERLEEVADAIEALEATRENYYR